MTALSTVPAAGDVSTRRVLARTCAAEWTRLWSVRTTWWCLLAAAVVTVGLGAVAGSDAGSDVQGDPAWVAAQVSALPAQLALLALALATVASDYATGGIVASLQWTTRRTVLFAARATVAVVVVTVLGVVLGLASALTAHTVARPALSLPADEGLHVLSAVALVVASSAALAVGLGFLLRSTAGALVAALLLVLVLPVLLPQLGGGWASEVARSLPGSGAAFLLLEPLPEMTRTSAVTVLLVWPAGALLLGWLRLTRRDADR